MPRSALTDYKVGGVSNCEPASPASLRWKSTTLKWQHVMAWWKRRVDSAGELGKFHRVCGKNIQLSESDTVAERVSSYNDGIVYTEQPVPVGTVFQIKLLEIGDEYGGALSLGFTTVCPNEKMVPSDLLYSMLNDYWILSYAGSFSHAGVNRGYRLHINKILKSGLSLGCVVNEKGDLHYFVDGKDQGLACADLPTDKPLWGVADIYARATKIKSEFHILQNKECSNSLQLEQQLRDEQSHVQGLQQRLDESTQQLQQQKEEMATTREESQLQLQSLQQRLDESTQQLQQQREEMATTREESQQQLQGVQKSLDEATQQLQQQREEMAQQRVEAALQREEAAVREQESQLQLQLLQQRLDTATAELEQLRSSPQVASQQGIEAWKVPRAEVQILGEMARGAWGVVARGRFQGQLIAVKWPHPAILNEHTIERLRREVQIMAQVRHPNLLHFIAAVFDDQMPRLPPLIVMELLDTNLRTAYQNGRLSGDNKVPIFRDVAYALHYLHEHQEPIIHRDVSAPNVLLEELPNQMWRAKVSDFGSANLAKMAQTMGEGAIIYAAPETIPQAYDPDTTPPPQTTKIDVYSYGVLLCEVITCQFPDPAQYRSMLRQIQSQWQFMHELIVICTKRNPEERPTMAQVLDKLNKLPNARSRLQQRS